MGKKKMEPVAEVYDSVTDGLKSVYRQKIKPVEEVCIGAALSTPSPLSPPRRGIRPLADEGARARPGRRSNLASSTPPA
jgi:hypothetical protein